MSRIVYCIAPGARIAPLSDGQYEVTFGEGGRVRLSAPAVMPLLLVDGWRSQGQIEQLADRDHRVPGGLIDWVLTRMASAGLLVKRETAWRPVEFFEWPTHRCQGCGACCQGEWIGPLDPEFVAQTLPRLEGLREKYPRLVDEAAFVRLEEGSPALHLNSSSGQCVFLDDDMLCILHKEFGPYGKPALCRTFPLVRFEDDVRTRVGVGLMCLKHFDQPLESEPPASAPAWEAEHEALEGSFFHYYTASADALALEETLVAELRTADDPLEAALRRVARHVPGQVTFSPALELERQARHLLARLDELLANDTVLLAAAQQKGLLPARLNALRELAGQGAQATGAMPLVPSPEVLRTDARQRLVRDLLRRFFFLRQYLMFRNLTASLAALGLGLWSALALTRDGERSDAVLGEYLATFMRTLQPPSVRRGLFQSNDEAERLLAAFRHWWMG